MNTARFARLRATLLERRIPFVRVDAGSPDGDHVEPSIAFVATRENGVALAVEYDQLAIFWFDGERFWIVPAVARTRALALPVHQQ